MSATIRWGSRTKIISCPLCKKRFNSSYALAYHVKHAKVLCPKAEKVNADSK